MMDSIEIRIFLSGEIAWTVMMWMPSLFLLGT
jgi:hypothetical protein